MHDPVVASATDRFNLVKDGIADPGGRCATESG
jgi:hypothetical protein